MLFRPRYFYSTPTSPIPCPALLDSKPCTLPRCLFSHDIRLPPPPPAPPPLKSVAQPAAAEEGDDNYEPPLVKEDDSYEPQPQEDDDGYEPPETIATPKKQKTVDPRLKAIVENAEKQRDVDLRDKRQRSLERKVLLDVGSTEDLEGDAAAEVAASNSTTKESLLPLLDDWPTPAQANKKAKISKKDEVSPDNFYGSQPSRPKATGSTSDKASNSGTSSIMKVTTATTPAIRPLKRPLPDSPTSPAITKADLLKRPKTTTTETMPAAIKAAGSAPRPVSKSAAKPVTRLTLNPRPVGRAPAAHGVRIQFLQLLQTELTRLSGDPKDDASQQRIIKKCLDLEEEIALTKPSIYRNAMGKICMRYKKAKPEDYQKEIEAEKAAKKAKETPTPKAQSTTRSHLNNSKPPLDTGLTRAEELLRLRDFIASPEQLKKHGYILTPPTQAEIEQAKAGVEAAGGYEYCERCTTRFQVFPGRRITDGLLTTGGACSYHPGRRYGARPSPGTVSEQTWTCCNRTVGSDTGCTVATTHVFKVSESKRLALTFPFSKTPPNPNVDLKPTERALALDCEMSYTTHGMELTRITATAFPSGKIVIDGLVKPYGIVLDFNTQFSGVSSEMMTSAPPWKAQAPYPDTQNTELVNPTIFAEPQQLAMFSTPAQARKALYHYIGPETVLIGHALENDLLHLRMCHDAVVDTCILFPHTRGLPLRNKLKYMVERMLCREIQVDGGDGGLKGHDSAVDARCAAELVRWKIKEAEERRRSQ
ncbi:hypothetical protein FN846DRAFT_946927 [Sphaerosporella brunnea]|uniref:Exonuclease domain-containing protein n=1 Tax=Sphaerosporella brunnea TaxID=1250544 RepID=A0A5J5EY52_9PEZI|nr:hypothetical protein FN846DRAFT_946927 [Sphaerosporella brunnea]